MSLVSREESKATCQHMHTIDPCCLSELCTVGCGPAASWPHIYSQKSRDSVRMGGVWCLYKLVILAASSCGKLVGISTSDELQLLLTHKEHLVSHAALCPRLLLSLHVCALLIASGVVQA